MHIRKIIPLSIPFLGLFLGAFSAAPALAAVAMQGLFGDHMVLQRDMPIPIFGAAAPNEAITVKLGAGQAAGKAGADGRFLIRLPAQAAGGPFELSVAGATTVTFKDVYVGEVWIASGQSNMDYRVDCKIGWATCNPPLKDMAKEVAAANYPLIRSINIAFKPNAKPQTGLTTTGWAQAIGDGIKPFSALAYFFAREVQRSLPNVAVGMIHASFGASCIECWMSRETLAGLPSFAPLLAAYEKAPDYANQHNPYNCYNGQIYPLKPYAVRGAIWSQGESISRGVATYRDLQVELVKSWRRDWGQDMTFLVSQLADYNAAGFPLVREAQMQGVQMVTNAGLAVNIDIGEAANIHFTDKQDAGLRMGLAARAIAYKQTVVYSGPLYRHMAVEGASIRLFFDHADGGLQLKGGNATTFEIAGANGTYSPATAKVDQDSTLLVTGAGVTAPKAVRYAWAAVPAVSLTNRADPTLPASPFRTDAPDMGTLPTAIGNASPRASDSPFAFHRVRSQASGGFSLRYDLPQSADVSLELFDLRGHAWKLAAGRQAAGSHSMALRASRDAGAVAAGNFSGAEGVYFARLTVGGRVETLSLILSEI